MFLLFISPKKTTRKITVFLAAFFGFCVLVSVRADVYIYESVNDSERTILSDRPIKQNGYKLKEVRSGTITKNPSYRATDYPEDPKKISSNVSQPNNSSSLETTKEKWTGSEQDSLARSLSQQETLDRLRREIAESREAA